MFHCKFALGNKQVLGFLKVDVFKIGRLWIKKLIKFSVHNLVTPAKYNNCLKVQHLNLILQRSIESENLPKMFYI